MLQLSKKKIKKLFLKKNQSRKKINNAQRNRNKKYKSCKKKIQQRNLNLRYKTLRKKRGGLKGENTILTYNIDNINNYFKTINGGSVVTNSNFINQLAEDIKVNGPINMEKLILHNIVFCN